MKKKENNENGAASERFERQVFRTLVELGHVVPETEAEVRIVEASIEAKPQPLPESLRDGNAVLSRIKSKPSTVGKKIVQMPGSQFAEIGEELARAARKGAEISPEIEEKMRLNRAKADAACKRNSESK